MFFVSLKKINQKCLFFWNNHLLCYKNQLLINSTLLKSMSLQKVRTYPFKNSHTLSARIKISFFCKSPWPGYREGLSVYHLTPRISGSNIFREILVPPTESLPLFSTIFRNAPTCSWNFKFNLFCLRYCQVSKISGNF